MLLPGAASLEAVSLAELQRFKSARYAERFLFSHSRIRNQITDAWHQSANVTVGFPLVRVSDAEAGIVRITPATFGAD